VHDRQVKRVVREGYARIVKEKGCGCRPPGSCCGGADLAWDISKGIGYSDVELEAVPEGANLGLGCGNPVALASLKEGETVLDLGSGAGFDCFLAANRVGSTGSVIGVDMTPEMVEKARANAELGGYPNVEFRLGEIEHLPVADSSVDVVISNCVINLVPDKSQVFREAFRVLRPGGRLMVSDIVLKKPLPAGIRNSMAAYVGCLAGAVMRDDYLSAVRAAGFQEVKVVDELPFPIDYMASDPELKAIIEGLNMTPETLGELAGSVVSIKIRALKPC
jgi:arsenite methyltransferase